MHDPDFWNQYLSENSETLKNLVRESYPNKEFNDVFHYVCDRLILRLVEADTKYKTTDGTLGLSDENNDHSNINNYFKCQAQIIIQSYFWSVFIVKNYEKMTSIIKKKCWPEERKDVSSFLNSKIIHNDYRRLRTKKDKYTPDQHFSYVVNKNIDGFFYTNCNIPEWIEKLNNKLFRKVYQLLCCRKRTQDEVIDKLIKQKHKYSIIKDAIDKVQLKNPDCGIDEIMIPIDEIIIIDTTSQSVDPETISLKRILNVIFYESYENHPDDTLIIKRLKKDLKKLKIGPKLKVMLHLFFCEEYTYQEIADKMDMRLNQVTGQIQHIKRRLKEILKKYLK